MEAEKAKELRPVLRAIQQIKAKRSPVHKAPSVLPSLPAGRNDTASTAGRSRDGTEKTQARYAQFRSEKKTTLLEVAPVDDQLLAQMKRPTTTARAQTAMRTKPK
jgi:hypothetical protein